MIPAKADNHRNQPPAEHIEWFLTDVLLFTHLVHLPTAYASKTVQWMYALRSFKEISRRLGSFETVRRAFKIVRRTFEVIWCVIAAIADMVSVEMMTNLSLLK